MAIFFSYFAKKLGYAQLFMKFVNFCFSGFRTHQTKNWDRTQLSLKTSPEKCPLCPTLIFRYSHCLCTIFIYHFPIPLGGMNSPYPLILFGKPWSMYHSLKPRLPPPTPFIKVGIDLLKFGGLLRKGGGGENSSLLY